MQKTHLDAIQRMLARGAVGPSTVRGQGPPGVAAAVRSFLAVLRLEPFGTSDARKFAAELDRQTSRLMEALPDGAQTWGLARKCLNIFLREALYNVYLREEYGLERAEALCEIPLDSLVAEGLRSRRPRTLPTWPGVRHLDPETSSAYQAAASCIAAEEGIVRVHLDAVFWGADR